MAFPFKKNTDIKEQAEEPVALQHIKAPRKGPSPLADKKLRSMSVMHIPKENGGEK